MKPARVVTTKGSPPLRSVHLKAAVSESDSDADDEVTGREEDSECDGKTNLSLHSNREGLDSSIESFNPNLFPTPRDNASGEAHMLAGFIPVVKHKDKLPLGPITKELLVKADLVWGGCDSGEKVLIQSDARIHHCRLHPRCLDAPYADNHLFLHPKDVWCKVLLRILVCHPLWQESTRL